MKIDQSRINRLLEYLADQRKLHAKLCDSVNKEIVMMRILTLEAALITLGVPFK